MSQSGATNAKGGGKNVEIINADIGSATSVANIINLNGGTNVQTTASGNTVLVNIIGPPSATNLTQHGVLLGNGSSAINATAVGSTNTVLLGHTGADPTFGTVANAALQNSAITINTTGSLSGGGTVSLGGSITLNATGSSGTVTSVSGTANQVAVANGTTTPVISLIGPYTPATYTTHGVLIGEGTNSIVALAAGTAGQVLQSGGAGADPAYSTPTYPSASGTARKMLVSDGTNNVYSTETWAVPGTSGNVLTSDGTNWTSAAPSGSFAPNSTVQIFDDFLSVSTATLTSGIFPSQLTWATNNVASWAYSTSVTSSSHPGVISNSAAQYLFAIGGASGTAIDLPIILGGGAISINWVVYIRTLSAAGNRYTFRCGLGDTTNTAQVNGCYFSYTDNVSSGVWIGNTTSASSTSTAVSATTVLVSTWYNLGITINAAATSVAFFINGTQIANSPLATNIPSTGLSPFVNITGAPAATSMAIDLMYMTINLTTPR